MNKIALALSFATLGLFAGQARSVVTVTIVPDGIGSSSVTQVGSKWRVEVTINSSGKTPVVTVRGASTDHLQDVLINNIGDDFVSLYMLGTTDTGRIGSAERILSVGDQEVQLHNLRLAGDMGFVISSENRGHSSSTSGATPQTSPYHPSCHHSDASAC